MKNFFRILFAVFLITNSFIYAKRKLKIHKHRLYKQRNDVVDAPPRKGYPNDENRNTSKVYDTVHIYSDKTQTSDGLKRHYLGHINGLEQVHYDNDHQNGLNGVATADVGTHPAAPNVGYLDVAHGIATSLNSQKLQVGSQPMPAHNPSDEGLNPLPMYHAKDIVAANSALQGDHHLGGLADGHTGAGVHVVDGRVTDGLAEGSHIDVANLADQTVAGAPHVATSHLSQELSAEQDGASYLQHQQGAMNIVHANDDHLLSNLGNLNQHIPFDHHDGGIQTNIGSPEVLDHNMDNYHNGMELGHRIAHQEPVVISHPPIHLTKAHYHASYHDVEDQGRNAF